MQCRILAFAFTVASVSAINKQCVENVIQSVEDVASTAGVVRSVVSTCQNGTEADCLAGVRQISSSLDSLLKEAAQTASSCGAGSAACASDIGKVGDDINNAVSSITHAIEDCGKKGSKESCVVDVLDTASDLGHAALDIYEATIDCKATVNGTKKACISNILDTIADARQAAKDIKTAVKDCKDKKNCLASIETSISSVVKTAEEAVQAGESCGVLKASGCIADVEGAANYLLQAAQDVKAAKTQCSKGIFHEVCLKALAEVASDVAHSVMDVVKATSSCRKL